MRIKKKIDEKEPKDSYANTLKGADLEAFKKKFYSNKPFFPEKHKLARERIASMDPATLDSILNRKK